MSGPNRRVVIWTNMPNHYQRAFFEALRGVGVDLRVAYYARVDASRRALGWSAPDQLPEGERYVAPSLEALTEFDDWRERVHVVPGYGGRFLLSLAGRLSSEGVHWVHWSERARGGARWALTFPVKRAYAHLVNACALGAFGIGACAIEDFVRWGIRREKVALLTYAPRAVPRDGSADEACARFRKERKAFLFLGSLNYRKGIDLLIDAFARSGAASRNWCLLLVGADQTGGAYARIVAQRGLTSSVLLRGSVTPDALPSVLRTAKVLVLPSRLDGWGVVLNEAASAGLALIASDQCGASEHLIGPATNGFIVQAGSVDSLARAMRAYVQDDELATAHGARSLDIFETYSPEKNALRFVQALDAWSALGGGVAGKVGRSAGARSISTPATVPENRRGLEGRPS